MWFSLFWGGQGGRGGMIQHVICVIKQIHVCVLLGCQGSAAVQDCVQDQFIKDIHPLTLLQSKVNFDIYLFIDLFINNINQPFHGVFNMMWRAGNPFISCVIAYVLKRLCRYNVKTIKSKSETRFYLLHVQNENDVGPTLYFFKRAKGETLPWPYLCFSGAGNQSTTTFNQFLLANRDVCQMSLQFLPFLRIIMNSRVSV